MSAFNVLQNMLDDAGIEYTIRKERDPLQMHIDLEAQSRGVAGYLGFVATFSFDGEGNLNGVGVWE